MACLPFTRYRTLADLAGLPAPPDPAFPSDHAAVQGKSLAPVLDTFGGGPALDRATFTGLAFSQITRCLSGKPPPPPPPAVALSRPLSLAHCQRNPCPSLIFRYLLRQPFWFGQSTRLNPCNRLCCAALAGAAGETASGVPKYYPCLSNTPPLPDTARAYDYMGYSVRSAQWRMTQWFPWNSTALCPQWASEVVAMRELYDHQHDTAMYDMDGFENDNVADDPVHHNVAANLSAVIRANFGEGCA